MRFGQYLSIAVALLAASAAPAHANTQSHDFGPHTKLQVWDICKQADGKFITGPGKWDCTTRRWAIACISYGKTCRIDLLALLPAEAAGDHLVTSAATTAAPQHGTGLSGNGGAGGVGGTVGGGTKGSIGHP